MSPTMSPILTPIPSPNITLSATSSTPTDAVPPTRPDASARPRGRARLLVLTTVAATLASCASIPDRNAALDEARIRFRSAQTESQVNRFAAEELARAGAELRRAEKSQADGDSVAQVDHLSYLTVQRVTIAQETAAARAAQEVTAGAAAERDRMRLALRTEEADAAQSQLADSEREGVRKSAELAQADRNAAADQSRLAQADRLAADDQLRLLQAERSAADDRARLARRDARVDSLEQQLAEINGRRTERGIVVTLGDLLFDTGRAELQAEGARSVARLAEFMKRNPQRRATVEGHTDDVGGEAVNQTLSERRARAVQAELVSQGVDADRLSTRGRGEAQPVAGNDTAAGRRMNRRVEVVFAPESGDLLSGR